MLAVQDLRKRTLQMAKACLGELSASQPNWGKSTESRLTNPNTKLPSLQHKSFLKFNLISRLGNELWPGFNSQWKCTTSQSHSPVCFYSGYGAQKAQTHPTLNTWRIVSLLKVSTIYQAQAFSQGCQAWGFKKGTQAEGEQEMQGNKARLEFKRCTFNSNRKKDRRTLGSSSNSLREGQHSLNTKENITRPLQQIQPPDNKEVSILSQLMISQADGNRSIIAASRVPEI